VGINNLISFIFKNKINLLLNIMDNVCLNEVTVNEVTVNEVTVNEEPTNNDIKILMRQTTYTEEECKQKLKLKSLEECINEYLGYNTKVEPVKSTNQNIFKAIREYFYTFVHNLV
jgi:hypothetical protein